MPYFKLICSWLTVNSCGEPLIYFIHFAFKITDLKPFPWKPKLYHKRLKTIESGICSVEAFLVQGKNVDYWPPPATTDATKTVQISVFHLLLTDLDKQAFSSPFCAGWTLVANAPEWCSWTGFTPTDDVGHACSPLRFWAVTLPSASESQDRRSQCSGRVWEQSAYLTPRVPGSSSCGIRQFLFL